MKWHEDLESAVITTQDRGLAPPTQATTTLLGWLVALTAAIWVLSALGSGPLAVPSILEGAEWRAWLVTTDAATIVFAVLRLSTLAIAWYLFGTVAVGTVAHLIRSARLLAVASFMALPTVRRMLQAAFGAGLAAASLTAGSSSVTSAPPAVATAVEPATLATAPDERPATPDGPEQPEPPLPTATPDRVEIWTVEPGDHLWSIAERTLAQAWDRHPSDDETTDYWQRLVARNRSVLTDPGNPDLIVPGQVFELPDIAGS